MKRLAAMPEGWKSELPSDATKHEVARTVSKALPGLDLQGIFLAGYWAKPSDRGRRAITAKRGDYAYTVNVQMKTGYSADLDALTRRVAERQPAPALGISWRPWPRSTPRRSKRAVARCACPAPTA